MYHNFSPSNFVSLLLVTLTLWERGCLNFFQDHIDVSQIQLCKVEPIFVYLFNITK